LSMAIATLAPSVDESRSQRSIKTIPVGTISRRSQYLQVAYHSRASDTMFISIRFYRAECIYVVDELDKSGTMSRTWQKGR